MRVTFVGTGAAIPSLTRSAPSLLVQEGDYNMVIDMGPGALARLLEHGVTHLDITHIVVTHFHTDHALDLAAFFQAMAVQERERPLTLIGPLGFHEFLKKFLDCFDFFKYLKVEGVKIFELGPEAVAYSMEWHKRVVDIIDKKTLDAPPFKLACARVEHKPESTAYRISGPSGKSLAVSGDTGLCDGVVEIGKGADLLILECSLPDDYAMEMHLTPAKAAEIAEKADPKRLALTHLYPIWDGRDLESEIKAAFGERPVIIAEDGMSIEI